MKEGTGSDEILRRLVKKKRQEKEMDVMRYQHLVQKSGLREGNSWNEM